MMPYGVGIIGAGPGVAALHLPTLARLSEEFEVVHVSDAGSGRAARLAERVGARSSPGSTTCSRTSASRSWSLCSPPAEHAGQILASVAAGKRAILCEKPLATTVADAEAVDRRVPRGRHRAAGRHQPPLRPGVGQGQASPARRRPGARDLGHPRAAAERPVPRRRDRAAGARRAPGARRPDLRCPRSRHPSSASSSRDSPCTICRCCATSRR